MDKINIHLNSQRDKVHSYLLLCFQLSSVFAPHRINASTRTVRVRVSVWVRILVRDRVRFGLGLVIAFM